VEVTIGSLSVKQYNLQVSPFYQNFDFEGRSVRGFKQRQKLLRTHYGHLFLSFETGSWINQFTKLHATDHRCRVKLYPSVGNLPK